MYTNSVAVNCTLPNTTFQFDILSTFGEFVFVPQIQHYCHEQHLQSYICIYFKIKHNFGMLRNYYRSITITESKRKNFVMCYAATQGTVQVCQVNVCYVATQCTVQVCVVNVCNVDTQYTVRVIEIVHNIVFVLLQFLGPNLSFNFFIGLQNDFSRGYTVLKVLKIDIVYKYGCICN